VVRHIEDDGGASAPLGIHRRAGLNSVVGPAITGPDALIPKPSEHWAGQAGEAHIRIQESDKPDEATTAPLSSGKERIWQEAGRYNKGIENVHIYRYERILFDRT
jgi:hypothetical protein